MYSSFMRLLSILSFFLILCSANVLHAQDIVNGKVLNAANDLPLENVNIVNLNQVKGTITTSEGDFEIQATVNDTL
jgi:hypothetical protein